MIRSLSGFRVNKILDAVQRLIRPDHAISAKAFRDLFVIAGLSDVSLLHWDHTQYRQNPEPEVSRKDHPNCFHNSLGLILDEYAGSVQ
jgi:hypothetical protein